MPTITYKIFQELLDALNIYDPNEYDTLSIFLCKIKFIIELILQRKIFFLSVNEDLSFLGLKTIN